MPARFGRRLSSLKALIQIDISSATQSTGLRPSLSIERHPFRLSVETYFWTIVTCGFSFYGRVLWDGL